MGSIQTWDSMIQPTMVRLSLLFVAICLSRVAGECLCNGDGDSDHWAPCSSDYGDGLDGNSELRRWCYVDRGDCWDEKEALETPRWWSHQACYKDGPPDPPPPRELKVEDGMYIETSYASDRNTKCVWAVGASKETKQCVDQLFESYGRKQVYRYGGGGSGSYRRGGNCGRKWCLG